MIMPTQLSHLLLVVLLALPGALSFSTPFHRGVSASIRNRVYLSSTTESVTGQAPLAVPTTFDEMVRQAASAMKKAATMGKTRQIARILLPRDSRSGDFGTYIEAASDPDELANTALVPPDESWQGGIGQIYRAAAPTCTAILRKLVDDAKSGLPPRVTEDRSVDESGVDGVGLFETDDNSVSCWLQPTQEVIDNVISTTNKNNKDLTILLNPQWRMVDDALDSASQGTGFLAGLASFMGGKGGTLKSLSEAGFVPVYTLEGYVCRGANVRLLQVLDSDWNVFCERDDQESFFAVGTSAKRPTYQEVDAMLNNADVGYKYARDMGLSPKL
jgi:hypothetical protein